MANYMNVTPRLEKQGKTYMSTFFFKKKESLLLVNIKCSTAYDKA